MSRSAARPQFAHARLRRSSVFCGTAFISFVLALLLIVSCSGSSDGSSSDLRFPARALMIVTSAEGRLKVEVRSSPQPLTRGVGAIELVVTDALGAPQSTLSVTAIPWMVSHGHGTSVTPNVLVMGDGRYVLTNVNFFMPGKWELRTTMSGSVSDHVALSFDIL
ncbi:MAG: hypothetical protein NVSMB1_08480 [Polyangiales bacterium]